MSLPLALFLLSLVTPLFFGSPRTAPFWLFCQAMSLMWIELGGPGEIAGERMVSAADTLLLRGLIAPWLFLRAQRNERRGASEHLYPSNLFVWTIAVVLLVFGFIFGASIASEPSAQLFLGAIVGSILLTLLLLASNDDKPAQLVGVLFIENALLLFEVRLPEQSALLHLVGSGIYLGTIALLGKFLAEDPGREASEAPREVL